MAVRAKFFVTEIKKTTGSINGPAYGLVTLSPVYGDENKSWSAATPSGKIVMAITNEAAVDQFQVGKAFYVDFSPAE